MIIDRTAPTAILSVTPQTLSDQTVFNFTGTADDTNFSTYRIDIKDSTTNDIVLTPFANNLPVISSTFGGLSEFDLDNGTYIAELTVEDRGGSSSTFQTPSFMVNHPDIDVTAPEISVDSLLNDPTVGVLNGVIPISISAFDENGVSLIQVAIDNFIIHQFQNTSTVTTEIDLSNFSDGVHTFLVAATDTNGNQGVTSEVTFLSSSTGPDFQIPSAIITLPDTTATLPTLVDVVANAEDNRTLQSISAVLDSGIVAEELISGTSPQGTLSHQVADTTFTEGTHTLTVRTIDSSSNTLDTILVTPAAGDTTPPQLSMQSSVDNATGPFRGDIDIRVSATDDQIIRQILLYLDGTLISSLSGFAPLHDQGELNYTLLASDLPDGAHNLVAKVIDTSGNISSTVPINFTSSNPIANFEVSPNLVRPGLPTGTIVTVIATLQQDTPWRITVTGPTAVSDITGSNRNINETINVAGLPDGEYVVQLSATGILEQPSAAFTVDLITGPTVAEISNVTENQVIRDGLFDLQGAADDPDSTDEVSYKVTVHNRETGALIRDVTPQPVNALGFHENRIPPTGSLGDVDFTMIRNGIYNLRLTVKGGTDTKTVQRRFILESDLKVGQFSFSQQDMVIPVNGQPLTVIRTYNSLNPNDGDFGHSWTWSISDVEMELDEERALIDGDSEFFSQRVGGGRNVTLTLPDGRRTTFTFVLESAGRFKHRAKWIAPPGVYATLHPTVSNELVTLFFGLQYWQAGGPDTPIDAYDFPGFILTTKDGTEYIIERENLGDHFVFNDFGETYFVQAYGDATLTQINQRSGDRIEFNTDRIDYFDTSNVNTKSIVFSRNGNGRIDAIHDPNGLDGSGNPIGPAAYTYEYDSIGNLTKVNRLIDKTDIQNPVYETTTYVYSNANFPHFITEIQDPRGVTPMRNLYDNSGRLVGVVDAFGNEITLSHDTAANTETIFDREGNPTIHVYDDRGNVISSTDSQGNSTGRTYDTNNNETSITDALGNTTSFTYDNNGNRTSVTDSLGNTTTFAYDNFGNQTRVTDPLGNTTTNQYDGSGKLITTINALGQTTRNTYNSKGNLSSTIDALGNTTATFDYDSSGNLDETTDAFGFIRNFSYDTNGNQTGTTYQWVNPDDNLDIRTVTTQTFYDAASQVIRTIDPENNESSTLYNEIGKPIQTTDKLGNDTFTTYDARGNVIETIFPDGTQTRTVYDANGRAVVSTDRYDPNSSIPVNGSRTIYDAVGRVVRSERLGDIQIDLVSDGNGGVTSDFIFADRVISSTSSVYDPAGRVIESFNADGEVTQFEYDDAGRQTAVIDALDNRTEFEYDAAGRQILVRDALGRETQFEYDALGRRTKTIFQDVTTTITTYNELGQRIAETDQNGLTREFEYDVLGRLTAVVLPEIPDPENNSVLSHPRYEYDYDIYGRLASIRDPKGRETQFTYDELGRQLTRELPLGQSECQSYNALGQLEYKADFKGQVTEFIYDTLGRVQEKRLYNNNSQTDNCSLITANNFVPSTSPDEVVTSSYDELGRQSQITEARGITDFTYDLDGRLVSIASPEGTLFYEYEPETGRKERTFTANSDILYDYDELGRLKTVTVLKQNGTVLTTPEVTTYDYTEVGSREAIHYANGTRTTYQYDSLNRLTNLTNLNPLDQILSSYNYTLAPNGRRTGVTESRLESDSSYSSTGITYTYDNLNRLIQEASGSTLPEASFTTDYSYDLVGNRLQKATNTGIETELFTYNFNGNDQLTTENQDLDGNVNALTYSYDDNGSLVSKVVTGADPETNTYSYNLENRLASATITRIENSDTLDITTSYEYNQSGIRVKADSSVVNQTTSALFDNEKTFLIDPNNHTGFAQVLEEYNPLSSGTPSVSYTIGSDVISQATSVGTSHLMYDGHGSTRLLTDSSGSVTDRYSFDAYGVMLGGNPTSQQPSATSLLYSGETFDVNLQQQYLRARWYDQNNGRFNRVDPFNGNNEDPQSLHKYTYAHDDPIGNLDPSGEISLSQTIAVTATIAIIAAIVAVSYFQSTEPVETAPPGAESPPLPGVYFGIGAGFGGTLFVFGRHHSQIRMFSSETFQKWIDIQAHGWRFGLGLGAGAGASFFMAFNIDDPHDFEKISGGGIDWEVDVGGSLGTAIKSAFQSLKLIKHLKKISKVSEYKAARKAAEEVVKNASFDPDNPSILQIGLGGVGAQVSIHWKTMKVDVLDINE